jgi:gliding motility-associated-like protein
MAIATLKKIFFFTWCCLTICKSNAQSVGGTTSGAKEYCDNNHGGFISVTGYTGTIIGWDFSTDGGKTWSSTGNTISVQSYSNLSQTTCYRAQVQNGTAPVSFSTTSCVTIYAPTIGGTISGGGLFCDSTGAGSLTLTGSRGAVLNWQFATDSGRTWTNVAVKTSLLNYSNITRSTVYRAMVQNAAVCKVETSVVARFIISPSRAGKIIGGGTYCSESGDGALNLKENIGSVRFWQYSINNGKSWVNITNSTTQLSYVSIKQNTLYRAVVQNGQTCPVDTSPYASFLINPSRAGVISGLDSVCKDSNSGYLVLKGNMGQVKWKVSGNNGNSWDDLANSTNYNSFKNIRQRTLFKVVVKNGQCPSDSSAPFGVNIYPVTLVNAGHDTSIVTGQAVQLKGQGIGSIVWSPSDGLSSTKILNPVASPSATTHYQLNLTDKHSCVSTASLLITVRPPDLNGMVSTLFTPNGDGVNDNWHIQNIDFYPGNEVFVFNINGAQVYSKKGYNNDWQGTYNGGDLPGGTYFYVIRFDDSDKILKGAVDIVRK